MSRPLSHPSRIFRTSLLVMVLLGLTLAAGSALAQQYTRGYSPPEDIDRILEEHRKLVPMNKVPLPPNWDWRDMDAMTPAKQQGDCGSCWAFAATGEMEAKIRIYYGLSLDLSEQQIVSCNPYGAGCDGGWAGSAYYVMQHYGQILEHCMPYEGSDNVACRQDDYLKFTDMNGWSSIANNVDQIKTEIMNNGPVCTAVDANDDWDGYTGGVIESISYSTNHLVLIVGWDDRVGDDGAWIIKNSWGSWGMGGYGYVAYGACAIGSNVTSLDYTPPTVELGVSSPNSGELYLGDETIEINWYTQNEDVETVDLYYGTAGSCQDNIIAENVPNTGSYEWVIPNVTTERASVLVFPSEGTHRGFGFTEEEFTILGHQTRYVSSSGLNMAPYDSPANAAHSIADAVIAGAGRDTVMVTGGDYLESGITVNSQCHIIGGWNANFTTCDPATTPTRIRGVNGAIRFGSEGFDYCGVTGITFHDCQGVLGSVPENGRHGAAIISVGASPVIEDCRFENNRAEPGSSSGWGGAVLLHEGSPVITDCVFEGNVGSHGGALAISQCDLATVTDCQFMANANSDSTLNYFGAGIYVSGGHAVIEDCSIRGGGAGFGGGLAIDNGAQVECADLELVGNRSQRGGAGVYLADGQLEFADSRLQDNVNGSGNGAGLLGIGGELDFHNVLVTGNITTGLGGGVYLQGVQGGTVRNAVFHANSGLTAGGAFFMSDGPLAIHDNTFTGNTGGGFMLAGAQVTSDWNIAHGNTSGDFLSGLGANDLVADPVFVDAAGGNFALGLHSPAIDSGSDQVGTDWDGSTTDRGWFGGPTSLVGMPHHVNGLQVENAGGSATLTWQAVDGAVTYAVYRDMADVFAPSVGTLCGLVTAPDRTFNEMVPAGDDWYYTVCAVDDTGCAGGFSDQVAAGGGGGASAVDNGLPRALAIESIAPNPFNPRAQVRFAVPVTTAIRVQVFDLRGRLVRTLQDGVLAAGNHTVTWDGTDGGGRMSATGVYFVRLDDGRESRTVKAVLAK